MWFNPFVAQVDVMCGTETGFGGSCQVIAGVTNQNAALPGRRPGRVRRPSATATGRAASPRWSSRRSSSSSCPSSSCRRPGAGASACRAHAAGPQGVRGDAEDPQAPVRGTPGSGGAGARLHPGRPGHARRRAGPGARGDPGGSRRPSSPAVAAARPSGARGTSRRPWPWPSSLLAIAQRLLPLEQAPLVALAIPVVGLLVLLVLVVRARPTLGETALAVDAEGGAGDAVASALAFASAMPATAGPAAGADDDTIAVDGSVRHRRGRGALRAPPAARRGRPACGPSTPALFRPRLARRPAAGRARRGRAGRCRAGPAAEPEDLVIAQNQRGPRGGGAPGRAHRRDRRGPRGQGRRRRTTRARSLAEELRAARRAAARQPGRPGQRTSPSWAPSRTTSAPSSIPPTSRRRPRSRRSRALALAGRHRQPAGQPGRRPEGDQGGPRATWATRSTR